MFLYDLATALQARKDPTSTKYLTGAQGAQKWLTATAVHEGGFVYWRDVDDAAYGKDPSWHWGSAGIVAFLLRMNDGTLDIPGEQPALKP